MNRKDLGRLRKIISKKEDTPVSRIASCYVETGKTEPRFQEPESFSFIEESEVDQLLAFFKKSMAGNLGTTAFEIDIRDSDAPVEKLRGSSLTDENLIKDVCYEIAANFNLDENYGVYFAYGDYDVPPDRESGKDESEEVYRFILVMIQPCKLSKPGIKYDYPKNNFTDRPKDRLLEAPVISFLYPSFDEGHTDIDHAMCFIKTAKNRENYQGVANALFGAQMPASVETQKEGFTNIMGASHSYNLPYETAQSVYEKLNQIRIDSELSGEEVKLTARDLKDIVKEESGAEGAALEEIDQQADKYAGCEFSLDNIAPRTVGIKTSSAVVKVDLSDIGSIQKKTIDGIEYFLIPVIDATIEGIGIR